MRMGFLVLFKLGGEDRAIQSKGCLCFRMAFRRTKIHSTFLLGSFAVDDEREIERKRSRRDQE